MGTLSNTGESRGHYICDVKHGGKWFRTNDDCLPVEINVVDVTKNGYAFLFQRVD